jgi:hypothetical protein
MKSSQNRNLAAMTMVVAIPAMTMVVILGLGRRHSTSKRYNGDKRKQKLLHGVLLKNYWNRNGPKTETLQRFSTNLWLAATAVVMHNRAMTVMLSLGRCYSTNKCYNGNERKQKLLHGVLLKFFVNRNGPKYQCCCFLYKPLEASLALIVFCTTGIFRQESSYVHKQVLALDLHRKHIHLRPLRRLGNSGRCTKRPAMPRTNHSLALQPPLAQRPAPVRTPVVQSR